jgi:hypothetical protein
MLLYALLMALSARCAHDTNVSGVGSGGEAKTLVGKVINEQGDPVAGVVVTLLPADYNPITTAVQTAGSTDTTNVAGEYALAKKLADTTYVLYGRTSDGSEAFIDRHLSSAALASGVAPGRTIQPCAIIKAALAPDLKSQLAVYVAGTPVQMHITARDSVVILGIPAGSVDLLCFDSASASVVIAGPSFAGLTVQSGSTLTLGVNIYPRIEQAESGDTIWVDDGDYHQSGWLNGLHFDAANPVVVKARNRNAARIVSGYGININNCQGIAFDGFEIAGPALEGDMVQVQGASSDITIRNCVIHSGGPGSTCIHANGGTTHLTIEGCVLSDPGTMTGASGRQGTISFERVDSSVIRGCLFSGTLSRYHLRLTQGSSNIIIENNIITGHNGSNGDPVFQLGGSSAASPGLTFEASAIVLRNNIIMNSQTGVAAFANVNDVWFVNNLTINCTHTSYDWLFLASGGIGGASQGVHIINNIFKNGGVAMPPFILKESVAVQGLEHSNNIYFNNGFWIPSAGAYDPNVESGVVLANPQLTLPAGTTYAELLISATPAAGSSRPGVDAGSNSVLSLPRPGVVSDIRANIRPVGVVDIGPFEMK